MPKFNGTSYELLSAPISPLETVLAFVGAAATKSVVLGLVILGTAALFVPLEVQHPLWMLGYLALVAIAFSLAGFIIGLLAQGFEALQFVPMLVITPLSFLGGAFYSIRMLPETFQLVSLFNPIVYVISGFRWSFYGAGDVNIAVSVAVLAAFLVASLGFVWWVFRSGYRLKS
jgi:ABC-2 type transport system permease protein